MSRFTRFAAIDWSGQAVARPKGLALAVAEAGGAWVAAGVTPATASPSGKSGLGLRMRVTSRYQI